MPREELQVCVRECACVRELQVCIRECACVRECVLRTTSSINPHPPSCLGQSICCSPRHTPISLSCKLTDTLLLAPISLKRTEITNVNYRTWLYVSSGNLNSGPHICTAKTSPTETSPHSLENK